MASLSILLLAFTLKLSSFFVFCFFFKVCGQCLVSILQKHSSSMLFFFFFFLPSKRRQIHLITLLQLKALKDHFTNIAHCSSPLSKETAV